MNTSDRTKRLEAFPFLRTEGLPFEVGKAHGTTFGERVGASVAVYRERFVEYGIAWPRALEFAERAGEFLRGIDPGLAEEIDGIAAGAEVDPREVMAINIRTGVFRLAEYGGVFDADHECTTAAILPEATADGHTLLAQNWDQNARLQPNTVVIEQHIAGEPALLFVTEAGILFRHGMSDAGLGIAGNGLRSDREDSPDHGLPACIVRRRALRHDNLAAARREIENTPRSHSGNHLLADAAGTAVDLEVVPGETFPIEPEADVLVHSNHFQHPDACATLHDHGPQSHPDTLFRDGRVREHLTNRHGHIRVEDVREALKDHYGHPKSVCRHAEDPTSSSAGFTLASSVWNLTERRMWTAPGPACQGTYTEYAFT